MSTRGNKRKRARQKIRHLKRLEEAKKARAPKLSRGLITGLDSPKGLIASLAQQP